MPLPGFSILLMFQICHQTLQCFQASIVLIIFENVSHETYFGTSK